MKSFFRIKYCINDKIWLSYKAKITNYVKLKLQFVANQGIKTGICNGCSYTPRFQYDKIFFEKRSNLSARATNYVPELRLSLVDLGAMYSVML